MHKLMCTFMTPMKKKIPVRNLDTSCPAGIPCNYARFEAINSCGKEVRPVAQFMFNFNTSFRSIHLVRYTALPVEIFSDISFLVFCNFLVMSEGGGGGGGEGEGGGGGVRVGVGNTRV